MHHRKAYGAHRCVTEAQQALFIAESITRRALNSTIPKGIEKG